MKLLIAVPTKDRQDKFLAWSYRYIPKLPYDNRVFVEPQDYDSYATLIGTDNLVNIGENNKGMGFVKTFIQNYALNNGYDTIFKFDDDVKQWSSGTGVSGNEPATSHLTLIKALKAIEQLLDSRSAVKAIAFNYKSFMHVASNPLWTVNRRLQSAYICRVGDFAARPDVSTFEDFYTTLSIWVNGGFTMLYNQAGMYMGGDVGKTKGGFERFDRDVMAKREIAIMRQLYPLLKTKAVEGKRWSVEPDMAAANRDLFPKKKKTG